ncbi:MAG: nuclear transport factor 2 family protein [Gammaproteobacteria bacterium]|nr:nuclear transport factor 2 family protein [Gammaproteobacteria bacterium]
MQQASAQALKGLEDYRNAERKAYNAADLGLVDHFTEDFILMSNGVPTVHGRTAARELFREIWSLYQARFAEVHDDVVVEAGEFLFVNGRFTLELIPRDGGETIFDRGRYQGVLKRDKDGKYLLWREATTDEGKSA